MYTCTHVRQVCFIRVNDGIGKTNGSNLKINMGNSNSSGFRDILPTRRTSQTNFSRFHGEAKICRAIFPVIITAVRNARSGVFR